MSTGFEDVPLFGDEGLRVGLPDEVRAELSADQRRTLRQAVDVALGVHPLTGGVIHDQASRGAERTDPLGLPFTCGSCHHRVLEGRKGRSYPKCDSWRSTHGAATDVRAWWPACPYYEPKGND